MSALPVYGGGIAYGIPRWHVAFPSPLKWGEGKSVQYLRDRSDAPAVNGEGENVRAKFICDSDGQKRTLSLRYTSNAAE